MKKKNKGFMLIETLVVSTFILGTLVFLYIQFINVKKSYEKSFRYNTVPNLYMTKNISEMLTLDDYNSLDTKLSNNATKGYALVSCTDISSSICNTLISKSNIRYVLYTSDDLSILKNYISTSGTNDPIFDPEFKKYLLQLQGGNISGRNRLIVYFGDTTFASIVLNSTSKEGDA